MKKSTLVGLIIFIVLLIDQVVKVWVKTHMHIGQDIPIFGLDWAFIHFVENPGMAFGLELGGNTGKLILSVFRIIAVVVLIFFIRNLIRQKAPYGLLACFGLITAGALGNIIDSAFYGLLFSASPYHSGAATFLPEGGGYASFLHGKVVDMLYFPLFQGTFPTWVPKWGGQPFEFFRPVFNVADSAITVGVISILLFQRNYFKASQNTEESVEDAG